jgi:tetratricopeptide (TPR) repeat protein/predicted Ser/Thr protein kinase
MTPERWQQIDNILGRVVDIGVAERTALLEELCTGDDDLREEVESLISFQEEAQSFLEVSALEEQAYLLCENQTDSMEGLVLGRYRIERQLGAGGMGEVYLAEDTNLDHKVAIKFLPSYLEADKLAKQRLILEAKAAAQLDHPNICAVYEVKEEAGRSFIVMQYVAGETLADRIKDKPLDLREALSVGIQIVEALAESHAHGIIHRDIKPRNVMINARGQVKVLDFGLAKLVDGTEGMSGYGKRSSLLSRPGQRAGTPPYMSPEQARGAAVDARCDLFAVGVILYECLSGMRPFAGDTDEKTLAQVRHLHPPPPSQLNPCVPLELDNAIFRSLAKEPDARYQSAEELLGDLRAARVALQTTRTWMGNLSGFLLRPLVFAPTAVVALSLAVLAYFVVPKLRPPHQPPPEAIHWYDAGTTALRNGAYYEASKALERAVAADGKFAFAHARLAEAYTELDYSDKAKDEIIRAQSLGNELRMQPLDLLYLQAVTKTVLRDFGPAIESYREIAQKAPDKDKARVYVDLGRAYEKNDQLREARENYLEATKLAAQDAAAWLRLGVLCSQQQDSICANEAFKKAEALYQDQGNLEGITEVLYQRSLLLLDEVKPPEARVELERALQLTKTTGSWSQQIRVLQELSSAFALEGQVARAEQQAADAIQLARDNGLEDLAADGMMRLGDAFLLRGDYSDAEEYYEQSLQLAQRDKLRLTEVWARRQLGSLRSLQHRTDEALPYIEQAVAFYQQKGYHKWLSLTLTLLGRTFRDKGDYEAALKAFEDLRQLGEQLKDESQVGNSEVDIGTVLSFQEQYTEALRHFDESYRIFKSLGARIYMGYAAKSRASVLWQVGRSEEATAALDEAASIAESPDGTYKQLMADIHLVGALMELSEGHLRECEVKSRQALDLAGAEYLDVTVLAKQTLGLAQARSGAARAGMHEEREAIRIASATADPQLLSGALLASAEAVLDSGATRQALDTAQRAQESFARYGKQDSVWRAWLIAALASQRLGNGTGAREYASYAHAQLSGLEQKWGSENYRGYLSRPDIMHLRTQLDQLLKP